MHTSGWINLILSVGFVTGLFAWCLWRVMRSPAPPPEDVFTSDQPDLKP